MGINYWAVLVCAALSMVIGFLWYGPLFGKKWLEIVGAGRADLEERERMQRGVWKLYLVQFLLSLFQVWVLAYIVFGAEVAYAMEASLWIWAAFIVPIVAGSAMWNNDSANVSWARFMIQTGYQLVLFVMFGLILGFWR